RARHRKAWVGLVVEDEEGLDRAGVAGLEGGTKVLLGADVAAAHRANHGHRWIRPKKTGSAGAAGWLQRRREHSMPAKDRYQHGQGEEVQEEGQRVISRVRVKSERGARSARRTGPVLGDEEAHSDVEPGEIFRGASPDHPARHRAAEVAPHSIG